MTDRSSSDKVIVAQEFMPRLKAQKTPPFVYVVFTAEIVPQTVETLIQALSKLVKQGVPGVCLAFSTPGGNVAQGITLYNFLRGVPFNLVAHNIGNVGSIGNAVFLAADTRYACPHSTFMFHGVGFDRPAARYEQKELKVMLDGLSADQKLIGSIISGRTKITQEETEGFFMEGQTKTAEFARERGIVDDIREFKLPSGAPVLSFVFQR